MKVVDVNVLLYAVNEDAERHTVLRQWWEEALNGDESVGLPWIVLSGFLRIATNPKVFPAPMPVDRALAKVETWICAETVSVIVEKPAHWRVLRDLLRDAGTAGNLATDAHLAAIAIAHDATLVSCDGDFARFRALRWENPLHAA